MAMQRVTDPAILYFGTPVVLVSTLNPDGTPNLAPMSSAWWLGHHAMLGLSSTQPVPERKRARGYRHLADKFGRAGLTAIPSDTVAAPRAAECPVQMEATLVSCHAFDGMACALEVAVQRVHAEEEILAEPDRIDPDAWRPLIMSFQRFYGLTAEQVADSRLAEIPESAYRR